MVQFRLFTLLKYASPMVGKDLCSTSLRWFLKPFPDILISPENTLSTTVENMLEKVTFKITHFDAFLFCLIRLSLAETLVLESIVHYPQQDIL